MKLFKFSSISFLVFFSFILSTPVLAATVPTSKAVSVNAVLLASVDIKDAKIISQKGNIFNISFSLSNGEGLQTGVKYGVELQGTDPKNQFVADEKIYEESLTLAEGSNLAKEIVYEAPKTLDGTYNLYLASKNESGFPFGKVLLGKVTLRALESGLQIAQSSCFLQVVGEKGSPHYSLLEIVNIVKDEKLTLTCSAMNSTSKDLSVVPSFEAFYNTTYGTIVPQTGGSTEDITFKSKEQKTFSINLPFASTPQIYVVKVKLVGGNVISNTVDISYALRGASASILNLSLDKDYYKKGDTAVLSLLYRSLDNIFEKSRIKNLDNTPLNLFVKASIINDKGQECITPIDQPLVRDLKSSKVEISASMKKDCLNPKVAISLLDDNGNILDQKNFLYL